MNYSIDKIEEEEEDYECSHEVTSTRSWSITQEPFITTTTHKTRQQQEKNVTRHFQSNDDDVVVVTTSRNSQSVPAALNSHAANVTTTTTTTTAAADKNNNQLFGGDEQQSSFFSSFPFVTTNYEKESEKTTMYYHIPTPISPLPSPTTSSSKLYTDHQQYDKPLSQESSILMSKALLSQDNKKTATGGEKRDFSSSRKIRPLSSCSLPRTKSAQLVQQKQQQQQDDLIRHKRRNSSIGLMQQQQQQQQQQGKKNYQQKRKGYYSLQPPPRTTRTTEEDNCEDAAAGGGKDHWDPHIDAFDILRAKITGITRSMQEFHVVELFNDEKRKKKQKLTSTTSSPLITSSKSYNNRRSSYSTTTSNTTNNNAYHRRIKSSHDTTLFSSLSDDDNDDDDIQEQQQRIVGEERIMASPKLTALFATTNNLIHSRLDELSASSFTTTLNDDETIKWRIEFLNLVTSCIQQSEALESLSTDVLNTEHRVRELLLINDTLHDQFNQREKQYEERIRECQEVAQQQLMMIESLEELTADINMKTAQQYRQEALLALIHGGGGGNRKSDHVIDEEEQQQDQRWDFQKSVAELLHMDDKYDLVQKMRWDIGMFVGGGVGTGHIIHTFEDQLNGFDMMIAGTGTTTTSTPTRRLDDDYTTSTEEEEEEEEEEEDMYRNRYSIATESYISPSINHRIKLYQHHYILHLSAHDRKTKFALLPKSLWTPDETKETCQFPNCVTRFTFFQRKHHCRKCGMVICARHSANRLPLFHDESRQEGQWSRVCDACFHNLIFMQQQQK